MENEKIAHQLALKYFSGKATGEEEKQLFEYVGHNAAHLDQLRRWARDWASLGAEDPATEKEWQRLQARMRMRKDHERRFTPQRRVLRRAMSVAAVTLLGLLGSFGVWKGIEEIMTGDYYTVEVPLGEKSRVVLSDGTLVWLNAGSTLRYPSRFGAFNRKVELVGEGYFEVTRKMGASFRVKTHAYDIRVTGTRFDVSAYPDDSFVTTTLAEGRVELLRGHRRMVLSPGESMYFDNYSGNFTRTKVDASLAYSWTENRIEFDNITLRELVAKLARQYNVDIYLQSESVREKRFHISLRNDETIGEVLDALKDIIPIKVERKGDEIYIRSI